MSRNPRRKRLQNCNEMLGPPKQKGMTSTQSDFLQVFLVFWAVEIHEEGAVTVIY